ncbi:hypothetical protein ACRAKI_15530 [Saccharothrix isguenensis]
MANPFAHVMECLASCQRRISSPNLFSPGNIEAALRALAPARRHSVLDGLLALTNGLVDGESTPAER